MCEEGGRWDLWGFRWDQNVRFARKGSGERTGSRLSFTDTLPMGEEEEDLVFLCVSAQPETWLGSRVMCGVAVPFAKKA